MSGHTDTLVAYVLYYGKGKVEGTPSTAKMTAIDQNKMVLAYQIKDDKDKSGWKEISVDFDPPLSGYEATRPRLMQMKMDAEEGLGMAKAPRLTTFGLKLSSFQTIPFLTILLVVTMAPYEYHTITKEEVPSLFYSALPTLNLASQTLTHVRQTIPFTPTAAYVIWGAIFAVHVSLALLVAFFSYKRRTGLRLGAAWVLSTLLIGYPVVFEFRQQMQAARINSIGKNH